MHCFFLFSDILRSIARAVNGLDDIGEGAFIKKTAPAVVLFCLVACGGVFAVWIAWELF